MPERYHVIITPQALADLEDLHQFISKDSEQNAAGFVAKLIDAIDGLQALPQRYRVYTGRRKTSDPLRRMPVSPYLIYYRVREEQKAVDVITIRHGARRPPRFS
jgi:toxin ParE1/3/4